jgi:hypothetical protein
MKNEVEFIGIISGDHEAFCWDVDKTTWKQIKGEAPSKYDRSCFNKGLYRLYPNDIYNYYHGKVKTKISFEIVEA